MAFACRLTASELLGADHAMPGAVEDVFTAGRGSPLIYASRAYGVPARLGPSS